MNPAGTSGRPPNLLLPTGRGPPAGTKRVSIRLRQRGGKICFQFIVSPFRAQVPGKKVLFYPITNYFFWSNNQNLLFVPPDSCQISFLHSILHFLGVFFYFDWNPAFFPSTACFLMNVVCQKFSKTSNSFPFFQPLLWYCVEYCSLPECWSRKDEV